MAVDSRGNIYITDELNQRVRRVDAAGTITTIAGTGVAGSSGDGGPAVAAQLTDPLGVAVDAGGTVYIADAGANKVRTIDDSGRIITKAGDGSAGFAGDGGPSTSARLNAPGGIVADAAGNIYIADTGNNRVRRINAAGVISTVAGSGTAGFSGDGGPAALAQLTDHSVSPSMSPAACTSQTRPIAGFARSTLPASSRRSRGRALPRSRATVARRRKQV